MTPLLVTDSAAFDNALLRLPRPHVLQTSHWAALKKPVWSSERYLWGSPEQPRATISILTRRLGGLPLRIQYTPKGPVVSADIDQWLIVLSWLEEHARQSGALFLKIDPDVDETRIYLVQDLLYSEGLAKVAYVKGVGAAPLAEPRGNLTGDPYFTDGRRAVMWVSSNPVSLEELEWVHWEETPVDEIMAR